uniref:transcription factor E2F7 n=1 Tax=Centroberyx gerrardi TaxID=166262 RepID=UPI003AAB29DF
MEVECLALKDLTTPRKSVTVEPEEEDGSKNEQKENICTERRRSTDSSVPVWLVSRKAAAAAAPDLAHLTPIKHTDWSALAEPWTPTANLKMLISAASPDIRDREMKKVLFRPIENEREAEKPASPETVEDTEVEDSCQFEAVEEEDDVDRKPSRKQKSLGLLCQKFLALYPDYPPAHDPIWISLDEVATNLGVERRRIYDIVNVLESLMIVGRIAKNCYTWYGRQRLSGTLEELQRKGRQQGYHLQMEPSAEARGAGPSRDDEAGEGDSASAAGNRKDKSLRIMSQKFVMLFLVSKTQTVTLDVAAKILIEESQDSSSHSKYKTKVRRLYDIANVLTSLSLIKKVHVREERGRKPAFQWLGPVQFNSAGNNGNTVEVAPPGTRQPTRGPIAGQEARRSKLARHASFNVTPTSVAIQRQVSSAPSSPRREQTGLPHQPVDYSRKTSSHGSVCRLQFGNTQQQQHHRLAYLPSLSQPSVVMLYRAAAAAPETPDRIPEGQRSPEERRKRGREEEEEEEEKVVKKRETSGSEERDKMRTEAGDRSQTGNTRTSPSLQAGPVVGGGGGGGGSDLAQPSHYLYVPNNAGLNSLNFLLSAGQPAGGLALPPGGVQTLALPYVLLPSAALSHYPLLAGGLQRPGADAHANLSFGLPAVMSPAHFVVGAAPFGLAAEVGRSPVPSPSTPEQTGLYGPAGAPLSPSGPRQTVSITTPEPLTPHTPKEAVVPASKAFFQTPGTLGSVLAAAPLARKRGSAQRRLDIGHPAN